MIRYFALTLLFSTLGISTASAINVVLDYTYATNSFFSNSTTNGQQARATLEAAAAYFSELLNDSFPEVRTPDPYISSANGGTDVTYEWDWSAQFSNPATGSTVSISNPLIEEDEFRIYVGARSLSGNTLGVGGPGGYQASAGGSYYFQWQLDEINAIGAEFNATLQNRNQDAGEFGRWGGAVSFDTGTNWNYDHTVDPSFGQSDLYSVALHELGHVIGLGGTDEWLAYVSGGVFTGPASVAANGGTAPPVASDPAHWEEGLESTIFGSTEVSETLMDPTLLVGDRTVVTTLDAAALTDIGWEVILPGDYDGDNLVTAIDYTLWRDSLGSGDVVGNYGVWSSQYGGSIASSSLAVPEPSTWLLVSSALVLGARRRC